MARIDEEGREVLFETITDLHGQAAGGGSGAVTDRVSTMIEDIQDKLGEGVVDMEDLMARIDEEGGRTPHMNVFYQECKYMNTLVTEIQKSLGVLSLGLLGELQMSVSMEELMEALVLDRVPDTWRKLAFESQRPLAGWLENLLARIKQLQDWVVDLILPRVVWISGFFNPQSFLTAIMQSQARKNEWALDKVVIATEVTKKSPEELEGPSREGSYVYGLIMEGARWDTGLNSIDDSKMKEMFCQMPVMLVKAVQVEKAEYKDQYMCPVYKTQQRNRIMGGYVFTANLKTKKPAAEWILAGVAMLMDVVV